MPLPLRITLLAFALQKYNADYDLSATQGADTLAFVSLLEEKLLPVLVSLLISGGHRRKVVLPRTGSAPWSDAGGLGCEPTCKERQRMLQATKSQVSGASVAGIRVPGFLCDSSGLCSQGWGLALILVLPQTLAVSGKASPVPDTWHLCVQRQAWALWCPPRQKAALALALPWPGHGFFSAADPHLLGGHKELRGAHAEVVH